jgi:hypothetical protein
MNFFIKRNKTENILKTVREAARASLREDCPCFAKWMVHFSIFLEYQKSGNVHLYLENLMTLSDDVINVPLQFVGGLEIHSLRFNCKKMHNLVHCFCFSINAKFGKINNGRKMAMSLRNGDDFDVVAANFRSLSLFKWTISIFGISGGYKVPMKALSSGNFELVNFIQKTLHCAVTEITTTYAAERGKISILKWTVENGYFLGSDTCSSAAKGGHLDILKWVFKLGYIPDKYTCSNAAINGHL